ncbi:hypothetical protein [Kitasatospora sp. NBC_00039]|uniref:hypothetical protein n=1 Tax=Kitasatospora sp. NBC_00039 TaxID=2903565 RepID=UPI003252ED49
MIETAYEAAEQALKMQSERMNGMRNRASGLLASAAIVASFSAGLGIINTDPKKGHIAPIWEIGLLLGILACVAGCILAVLWPSRFYYGPSAQEILRLEKFDLSDDDIRTYITEKMIWAHGENQDFIGVRANYFRMAIILTFLEVAVIVIASLPR